MPDEALVSLLASSPSLVTSEEAFAHVVEAAYGIETLAHLFEELHHSRPALRILDRGDKALRLVQHKVAMPLGALQKLAVDANVVATRIGFGSGLGDNIAIDLNAALGHELFGLAAAGDAGLRENFLKALKFCGWMGLLFFFRGLFFAGVFLFGVFFFGSVGRFVAHGSLALAICFVADWVFDLGVGWLFDGGLAGFRIEGAAH